MRFIISALILTALTTSAMAQSGFGTGPAIMDFGPVAPVPGASPIAEDATFKVSFDTAKLADDGESDRTLQSAARFINMHARAGVSPDAISLAVVVHGQAVNAVTKGSASQALIEALFYHDVRIIVCGQSAAYYGVGVDDLAPGVEMALSAMTAHALLQQDGYSLNPF